MENFQIVCRIPLCLLFANSYQELAEKLVHLSRLAIQNKKFSYWNRAMPRVWSFLGILIFLSVYELFY